MPERPLLVAAYAAGAGLAAATLVYVFGPTFLLDDGTHGSHGVKKRNVVGLSNPANDCFINSVLQALAGSPQLRLYLIKEIHLRKLFSSDVASAKSPPQDRSEQKRASLRLGLITNGLKDILDALNERPQHRKTISAQPFITAVERAFNTRVSRYQQDAQEFLQLVLERLADEHKEVCKVRKQIQWVPRASTIEQHVEVVQQLLKDAELDAKDNEKQTKLTHDHDDHSEGTHDNDLKLLKPHPSSDGDSLPFEGKLESQIECSVCHFKPRPSLSDFVTLTLNVPYSTGATTLDTCFDGVLKIEHIDGFRCDRCRLMHALRTKSARIADASTKAEEKTQLQRQCARIKEVMNDDPEHPPDELDLPPLTSAPASRISKHMRISLFPKVLAIHLSRSMWDSSSSSSKNMAKVSFPEILMLGPLLNRKTYHLFSMVTHKGGHNSGHYETFRRHWVQPPSAIPASMDAHGPFSQTVSPAASPQVSATQTDEATMDDINSISSRVDLSQTQSSPPTAQPATAGYTFQTKRQSLQPDVFSKNVPEKHPSLSANSAKNKKRALSRWWRISDDKIKECKASDVLSMQREVYLLFYELQ